MASSKKTLVVSKGQIDSMIRSIRGVRVMLDSDLAKIYGVPTFRFNEAIKRNRHRFPADFMFQLTRDEFDSLTSHIAISKCGRGGRRTLPYAFTEYGALMFLHDAIALAEHNDAGLPVLDLMFGDVGETHDGEDVTSFSLESSRAVEDDL